MSAKNKIAIVNSSSFGKNFPDHIERLEKIGTTDNFTFDSEISGKKLSEELHSYNIIIASVTPFFNKEFFDHKDELKLITRHGIGFNNIDLKAAEEHNTIVSIVPPLVERDAVAENNITNLLAVMRQTRQATNSVLNDSWEERNQFVGHALSGKTVGVIGVGNIGSRIVEILNYGFRANVIGYDPYKDERYLAQFGADKVDLDFLLAESDIICLSASLNDRNYHMLSREQFALMKDKVYLSNTARGALIHEGAMIEALANGKVAGFATDVLEVEPGRSDHPYLQFKNVIMTPHTSAYTLECLEGMGNKCVTDCEKVSIGILPQSVVQAKSKFIQQGGEK